MKCTYFFSVSVSVSQEVAFNFVSKHLPTLTEPLWGFSTNKVDLWESSRFSVSSGAPSPIDHTEMQGEREISIIWACFTPSIIHLPELTKLSNPITSFFRCPEKYVSFCSHWHPWIGCHIVYSSWKNATFVVTENETRTEEERATWSARAGTGQLEWHQHSTMSALQRQYTKVSFLFFRRETRDGGSENTNSYNHTQNTDDASFLWVSPKRKLSWLYKLVCPFCFQNRPLMKLNFELCSLLPW